MAALADKLNELAGSGKLAVREYRVRVRLNWHTKAKSAVRHMLTGEQKIDADEAREIEAAHAKYCVEQIARHRREDAALIDSIIRFAEQARISDAEFYRPHLEALRAALRELGGDIPDLVKPDQAD